MSAFVWFWFCEWPSGLTWIFKHRRSILSRHIKSSNLPSTTSLLITSLKLLGNLRFNHWMTLNFGLLVENMVGDRVKNSGQVVKDILIVKPWFFSWTFNFFSQQILMFQRLSLFFFLHNFMVLSLYVVKLPWLQTNQPAVT